MKGEFRGWLRNKWLIMKMYFNSGAEAGKAWRQRKESRKLSK